MAFWRMIKQGYDHFEVTHLEPRIDVCDQRYVVNAEATVAFNRADRCPTFTLPEDLAAAVFQKQHRDDIETTRLIIRGLPTVAGTRLDGGMHATFRAALKSNGGPGAVIPTPSGTIPADAHPPTEHVDTTIENFMGVPSNRSNTAAAE
jgi:hypothetical protein